MTGENEEGVLKLGGVLSELHVSNTDYLSVAASRYRKNDLRKYMTCLEFEKKNS